MVWQKIKQWFGKGKSRKGDEPQQGGANLPALSWIEPADNPWGVRLLDVRPITQGMLSTSTNRECAENAISFSNDDGTSFIGVDPESDRTVPSTLDYRIDGMLADGALFTPQAMEEKWAIYVHQCKLIFIRSWTRTVRVTATFKADGDRIRITAIRGMFLEADEDEELTNRLFDFLLRSHALGQVYPVPMLPGMDAMESSAGLVCFTLFGSFAHFAAQEVIERRTPDEPLRSNSLLHIAVARSDKQAAEAQLAAGVPIDLLAGDGRAPLHWAFDDAMVNFLLERGSPVDVRGADSATPLMNAVERRMPELAELFIRKGSDVNAKDDRGFTALHRAAEMAEVAIARMLVAAGASPDAEAQGHTPRSLANACGQKEILKLFT